MPLIEGRCKNCNGEIKFDSSRDKGFCSFCGTPFLREDLIINQHYHNDFSGANVIFNDLESVEKQLENAENNLTRLKNYDRAEVIYKNITEKASGEYRAWWGLVRVMSHDFTIKPSFENYKLMCKYAINAIKVTNDGNIQRQLKLQWSSFNNLIKTQNDEIINNNNLIITKKNEKIQKEERDIQTHQDDINKNKSLICELENQILKYQKFDDFLDKIFTISGLSLIFLIVVALQGVLWATFCCVLSIITGAYSIIKPMIDSKSVNAIKSQIDDLKSKCENEEKLIYETKTSIADKRNDIERMKQSVAEIYDLREL